jgi:hypothetical protein
VNGRGLWGLWRVSMQVSMQAVGNDHAAMRGGTVAMNLGARLR